MKKTLGLPNLSKKSRLSGQVRGAEFVSRDNHSQNIGGKC